MTSSGRWKTGRRSDLLREPDGKAGLIEKEKPKVDTDFEEITEGEEIDRQAKLKTKWAALEALVGTPSGSSALAETW